MPNIDWFVGLSVALRMLVIAGIGTFLELSETTVLWLIFGAVIAIGLSALRGQAAGLGKLLDEVGIIRESVAERGGKASP